MKRVGKLFDCIADRETLSLAAHRAAQGQRLRREVSEFLKDFDTHAARIVKELRAETYSFGGYRTFQVQDRKTRTIHAPPFEQRVVHHAIIAVAGPVFEQGAIQHSYACRKGRGQHRALGVARRWTRAGDSYLKLDVRKYYDSIDHGVLLGFLTRRFREQRLLRLFHRLLLSYQVQSGKGLPIGALTSQYLGNFYFDSFDHWVNEDLGHRHYLRYMDDMVFWGPHELLKTVRDESLAQLAGRQLVVKHGGELNTVDTGLPLLGFVVYPDRIRLSAVGRRRLRRKVGGVERRWLLGEVDDGQLQQRVTSLWAHAQWGDDVNWRRVVARFSRVEWDAPGPAPGASRRFVEQHCEQVPVCVSEQERSG
jgi:hypothetical protein